MQKPDFVAVSFKASTTKDIHIFKILLVELNCANYCESNVGAILKIAGEIKILGCLT